MLAELRFLFKTFTPNLLWWFVIYLPEFYWKRAEANRTSPLWVDYEANYAFEIPWNRTSNFGYKVNC